ncbi:methylation-associated defense system ATP-binding protein MAD8 [Streptomyces graminilatus]|uniref:methylation-associated defense system ATP-binding protein MAD8 n=1 Tax=Streptomyces graminilatus TaxID=1464070 RepID=UPI0006E254E0|nr:ATP-binding protein [Streptomyces graminilatus]
MARGLVEITETDWRQALEHVMLPRLADLLRAREPGHCMRAGGLDAELAARLTRGLRAAVPDAQVYVLAVREEDGDDRFISSTKLVELRNPDEQGRLRSPLLVFVPPGTKASAEDSFSVATFEEISLREVHTRLKRNLIKDVPEPLRAGVEQLLAEMSDAGDRTAARYLLTLRENEHHPEAAGAAVHLLGLVPDFRLFTDPSLVVTKTQRNRRTVEKLTEGPATDRQRILALGLPRNSAEHQRFTRRLVDFAAATGLSDPRHWCRAIAADPENWPLAFHHWPQENDPADQTVRIEVDDLTALPKAGENAEDQRNHPALERLFGQPYLLPGGLSSLPVTFSVDPDPRSIPGIKRFKVEICAETGDEDDSAPLASPTGLTATVSVTTKAKSVLKAAVKLKKGRRSPDWEEGWHFVRVTPLDGNDDPMPLASGGGTAGRKPHESDRFYVIPDGEFDEPPTQRGHHAPGLAQAINRLRFTALAEGRSPSRVQYREVGWGQRSTSLKTRSLRASFGPAGLVTIDLPRILTEAQQRILREPHTLQGPEIEVDAAGVASLPEPTEGASGSPLDGPLHDYALARAELFGRFVVPDSPDGTGDFLVVEGMDPRALRDVVEAYGEAYLAAVTACVRALDRPNTPDADRRRTTLHQLLRTDTLAVRLHDIDGSRRSLVLVAPTHPLRMLWWSGQAALADHWLDRLQGASSGLVKARLDSLEQRLAPLGYPLAVPLESGELAFASSPLTDYWQVCLPSEADDPREVLARVAGALGIDAAAAAGGVSGDELADRVEKYIRLHPYVDSLVINALGAGHGELLAEMLVSLQERRHLSHLHYTVRLFAAAPDDPWTGSALTDLMAPASGSRSAAAEAFATPGDPLRPKLSVVIRDATELRRAADGFPAHLTFLFNPFGGESHDIAPGRDGTGRVAVHGLVQEMGSSYREDDENAEWTRQPRHGATDPVTGAETTGDLLAALPRALSAALVAASAGEHRPGMLPQITVRLTPDDRALLHDVHQVSDWVVTVDRTLGAEYFDHGRRGRSEYVIDHTITSHGGLGHQIVVSSRSLDEMRALLGPVLADRALGIPERHIRTFFDQLRELSGSLVFKLAALGESQRTEVLGLALARLYLGTRKALRNQILVPIDTHPELYDEERSRAAGGDTEVRLHRTDLALFDLDAERRTIVCRLLEVKCHTGGGIGAYQAKRQQIIRQTENTERVLARRFDPIHGRADRPLQNVALRAMLDQYLSRAGRYGLFDQQAMDEARWLLERLDHGYRLEFTRSGLVFDLSKEGLDADHEDGVAFHRIGRDHAVGLLDAIATEYLPASGDTAKDELVLPGLEFLGGAADDSSFAGATVQLRPRPRTRGIPEEPAPLADDPDEDAPELPATHNGDVAAQDARTPLEVQDTAGQGNSESSAAVIDEPQAGTLPPQEGMLVEEAIGEPGPESEEGRVSETGHPDIVLGVSRPSQQFGLLGMSAGRSVALDLNETHAISLFGVQGGGKSYTLGSVLEMASLPVSGVNRLASPLASIVFHYSETSEYEPEFLSMIHANDDEGQRDALRRRFGAQPAGLTDVVLLVPEEYVEERQAQYPGVLVHPLAFAASELKIAHWKFLMGAVGNQSGYIRQIGRIIKANRSDLTLDAVRRGVEESTLDEHLKRKARERLDLAGDFIDDSVRLKDLARPGRLIIVDLRSDDIEKSDALSLFVVLMHLFSEATDDGRPFNKLVVFDEAHKYADSGDLVTGLVSSVREMRHKGMSVLVASQDPPSVPSELIELSTHMVLHRFTSPAWLKHLQKVNAALSGLNPEKLAALRPGEAYVWSGKATDEAFVRGTVKVDCRPRVTRHGGGTRTALGR